MKKQQSFFTRRTTGHPKHHMREVNGRFTSANKLFFEELDQVVDACKSGNVEDVKIHPGVMFPPHLHKALEDGVSSEEFSKFK